MARAFLLTAALFCVPGCTPPQPVLVSPKGIETPLPRPKAVSKTDAAKAGVAGRTVVAYCVNTQGKTEDVQVKESFTPGFDALAVRTVKRWTYEPATRDGTPERHCSEATIEFRP